MKKVYLLCALMVGAVAVEAQTQQGNMMAGGTLQFSSSSYQSGSNNESASFTLGPNFGYFVSDNFAVGLGLTFENERTGTGGNKTIENSFAIGPFARYYLFTSNPQFGFFGQAGLDFGSGKRDPAVGGVTRSNYVSFSVMPGAAFFFNEHWALELTITALNVTSYDPNKDVDNDKVTSFTFGIRSLQPGLGIRYHF